MFPVKVDVTWIAGSQGIEYPCEKEWYLEKDDNLFAVNFCYPYTENLDSEFARFLTRVVQAGPLPEYFQDEIEKICATGKRLADVVHEFGELGVNIELLEKVTEVFGLSTLEEEREEIIKHLHPASPIIRRYVLMQALDTQSYRTFVGKTNQQRTEILQNKQEQRQ